MRALWQRSDGGPIDEADIAAALQERRRPLATPTSSRPGCTARDELPLQRAAGARRRGGAATSRAGWPRRSGLRVSERPLSGVQVKTVLRGGAAERAGVVGRRRAAGGRRLAHPAPRRCAAVARAGRAVRAAAGARPARADAAAALPGERRRAGAASRWLPDAKPARAALRRCAGHGYGG